MTGSAKFALGSCAALLAFGAALTGSALAWAFCLGLGFGVAVCMFWPGLESIVRASMSSAWTYARRYVPKTQVMPHDHNSPIEPTSRPRWATNIVAFLWRWKGPLAVLVLLMFVMGAMRACVPFGDLGKSRGEIRLERDIAVRTDAVRAEVHAGALEISNDWNRRAANIDAALTRGRETLEDIPRETSELDFLLAWAGADRELLDTGSTTA